MNTTLYGDIILKYKSLSYQGQESALTFANSLLVWDQASFSEKEVDLPEGQNQYPQAF
jgi:hypothetical protein